MPLDQYSSIDAILEKFVPDDELKEIHRILYGWQGDERYDLNIIIILLKY